MKSLLLLLTLGKLGKFLASMGSMIISLATYSLVFGWRYALGLVSLLLVHELGHYVAACRRGLDVGLPTFIPFVGAWIELKEQPLDAETEAFVAIAGPMLGSLAAYLFYLFSSGEDSALWTALAHAGFMLNLFNLIPLSPLDGGRIVSVVSPKLWLLGLPILIVVFFWRPSPILLVIAILAVPNLWTLYRNWDQSTSRYYQTEYRTRIQFGAEYILLIIFLAILCLETHEKLAHVRAAFS